MMLNQDKSASQLNIISANVNGLGDTNKRNQFFNHIFQAKPDILCLSDTRFSESIHKVIKNETNYFCHFSSFSSNARGVAILVNKNCPVKIEFFSKDEDGNLLWLKCEFDDHKFMLGAIYGPNDDNPLFFENIFENFRNAGITNCIITGDFNVTLDHNLDNHRYVTERNPRARVTLNNLMNDYAFVDAHRSLYGDKKLFTWIRNGGPQRARLDMFLLSESLRPFISHHSTYPSFQSDHKPIVLHVDFSKFERGKGLWKHNSLLLKDIDYVNCINRTIKNTYAKYIKHNIYENFFQESSLEEYEDFINLNIENIEQMEVSVNPHVFLEMVLNDVRNKTITYSSAKNRASRSLGVKLLNDVRILQEKISGGDVDPNTQDNLTQAEILYNEFIEHQTRQQ